MLACDSRFLSYRPHAANRFMPSIVIAEWINVRQYVKWNPSCRAVVRPLSAYQTLHWGCIQVCHELLLLGSQARTIYQCYQLQPGRRLTLVSTSLLAKTTSTALAIFRPRYSAGSSRARDSC